MKNPSNDLGLESNNILLNFTYRLNSNVFLYNRALRQKVISYFWI